MYYTPGKKYVTGDVLHTWNKKGKKVMYYTPGKKK